MEEIIDGHKPNKRQQRHRRHQICFVIEEKKNKMLKNIIIINPNASKLKKAALNLLDEEAAVTLPSFL